MRHWRIGIVVAGLARWLLRLFLAWAALVAALMALYVFVPPVSTLMLGRWATLKPVERHYAPLTAISRHLSTAVVMSEDGRFCHHAGVDWTALSEVLAQADEDGPSRGASTITMQLAKNLFLWPGRSYVRKALEIPLAVVLDLVWSKKRIMEAYLNVAEWGDGLYGAEAASRRYFGKPAARITPHEAALLATALPNPRLRRPDRPGRRQLALARIVSRRAASGAFWTDCLK